MFIKRINWVHSSFDKVVSYPSTGIGQAVSHHYHGAAGARSVAQVSCFHENYALKEYSSCRSMILIIL